MIDARFAAFVALLASGCFDLGKVDDRVESGGDVCKKPSGTNLLDEAQAAFVGNGPASGWVRTEQIDEIFNVDDGCVAQSSTQFCNDLPGYLTGPLVETIPGALYRVHAWMHLPVPGDGGYYGSPETGTLTLQFNTPLAGGVGVDGAPWSYGPLAAGWQEIITPASSAPAAGADAGAGANETNVEAVLFFGNISTSCLLLNYVFMEKVD
jgi:hypothetical protein